jgi:caffeoyl-CoA O-methyltransferase
MFKNFSQGMFDRMRELEDIDLRDRLDGTPTARRMRQVPVETGKFLALLVSCAPPGEIIEIGTSAGYSTLWISRAGRAITTFELLENKFLLARETFQRAGITSQITQVLGDARQLLSSGHDAIAFCFLDAEKDIYQDCYDLVIPRLVPGGILAADNVTSHQDYLQSMVDHALTDPRVDSLVVPIGKGVLLSRKIQPT